ncbi:Glutaredoxin-C6 [Hibiscus syriacus]|uniref:Glutaredoxin-C6 n=1 Tax=Hibiscus syriacus TaxID=106335 RepID=A0A6A2X5Y3_HIBSY|nr:Glutaredoxin-C6 [Hibiscus syriacus]
MSSPTTGGGSLSIDEEETAETRIRRLISERPLIIFIRSSCCMSCHEETLGHGVHPTVIELDDHEFTSSLDRLLTAASPLGISPPPSSLAEPVSAVSNPSLLSTLVADSSRSSSKLVFSVLSKVLLPILQSTPIHEPLHLIMQNRDGCSTSAPKNVRKCPAVKRHHPFCSINRPPAIQSATQLRYIGCSKPDCIISASKLYPVDTTTIQQTLSQPAQPPNGSRKTPVNPSESVFFTCDAQEMVDASELTNIGSSDICSKTGVRNVKRVLHQCMEMSKVYSDSDNFNRNEKNTA